MSDNESYHFAPHDVAGIVEIGVQSVRRWAEYHSAYLSESATPKPGEKRAFTWADVETFRQIKALRSEGLSVEAINSRLSKARTEAFTSLDTTVSVIAQPAVQESHQDAPALIVALQAMQTQIDALQQAVSEDRIAKAEDKHSQREPVYYMAVGFLVACGLFILLLLLFLVRNWL